MKTKDEILSELKDFIETQRNSWKWDYYSEEAQEVLNKLENFVMKYEKFYQVTCNFCYCGRPVDLDNPGCVEFGLCSEHQLDA